MLLPTGQTDYKRTFRGNDVGSGVPWKRGHSNSKVECQASITALSRVEPGLPIDWLMPGMQDHPGHVAVGKGPGQLDLADGLPYVTHR